MSKLIQGSVILACDHITRVDVPPAGIKAAFAEADTQIAQHYKNKSWLSEGTARTSCLT